MKPKKIKLFWAVGLTVILLASATAALSMLWPRLLPSFYVSDLYRRYEHNDYVRATELHNFPVNDTLATDALLLEAATDSAWCELLLDFGVPEEMIELYKSDKNFFTGDESNSVMLFYRDKKDYRKFLPQIDPDSRLVIASFGKNSLCVFMSEDNHNKEIIGLSETIKLKTKKQ